MNNYRLGDALRSNVIPHEWALQHAKRSVPLFTERDRSPHGIAAGNIATAAVDLVMRFSNRPCHLVIESDP